MGYKKPKLEINNINQKIFTPGNTIEGLLFVNNFNNIVVRSLKLILFGEIETNFNVNNIIEFNEVNNIFKTNLYYDFLKNKFLHEKNNNNFLLETCQKKVKINALIPNINLPSAYTGKHFRIYYKLIIILDYINITNNTKFRNNIIYQERKINIIPFIYTFDDKYLVPIISDFHTKLNDKIIHGYFSYSIFIPYKCYIPGDKIILELKLTNLSNINNYVVDIKIELKKQLIVTQFFDYLAENENIFIYYKKLIHNKNNDTIIRFNDLQLPYNCGYSILSNSTQNLFEIRYVLKINVIISKDKKFLSLKESNIPIIIGSYRTNYQKTDDLHLLPKYENT